MLNQPSTWSAPVWTFRRSTICLALFGSLVLGCPGPEPSASGAGGTGAVGNGGQGGDDKVSSSTSTGPNVGGEGGGGMSGGGMNSGGEGPCGMAELVDCGCGFVCAFPSLTTTPECTMPGTCQLKCNEYQHDFVPDSPEDPMSWGCETRGRRVFVTSQAFTALSLGGVDQANLKCQEAAAFLGGTWKAWLTDSNISPEEDFEPSVDPYYLLDGTKVADNFDQFLGLNGDPSLLAAIGLTEGGMMVPNDTAAVWTGTSFSGLPLQSCGDWGLLQLGLTVGNIGNATKQDVRWTDDGTQLCTNPARLYCFEQ
jgi:hypothetical protein